ncbi:MAG: calcium/sodium antiporter [Candidatus Aminicenantaceae bacterium]
MIFVYFLAMILSFTVLFKCADWFVDGASALARIMNIPKMIVGIVLVGLATTAPEFGVSVVSAFYKHPEIALGNAVGSVICDDGIAIALAALIAPAAIMVNCRILKTASLFLLSIDIGAYLLAKNGIVGRVEGLLFIVVLCLYFIFILKYQGKNFYKPSREDDKEDQGRSDAFLERKVRLRRPLLLFMGGIAGVFITSRVVLWAAINIARYFEISETIIALTVIAIGTSLPEISTCITAALKGEGEIAVGDIIGADILNILWIIGMSSVVRPIKVEVEVINFTFPYMILVVATMLAAMRIRCRLGKVKGLLLITLYIIYIILTLKFFT